MAAAQTTYNHDLSGNLISRSASTATAPIILRQPSTQTIAAGGIASFSVVLADVADAAYQWRFNGNAIGGAIGDTLTLTSVSAANEGAYSVVVTSGSSSVVSSAATLYWDSDGDGLPDSWENTHFGNINQTANADADGDGISNVAEFRDGTIPTQRTSFRPKLSVRALSGVVTLSPELPSYTIGQVVTLSAEPFVGQSFIGWSGDASGNASQITLVMEANKTVTAGFGVPLATALDVAGATWTVGGDAGWYGQSHYSRDGVDAAQSGPISLNQQSWMETTVMMPAAGNVTFWWRASTEGRMIVTINGTSTGTFTGDTTWIQTSRPLVAGRNTLRWTYTRTSDTVFSDTVWVDQMTFTPALDSAVPAISSPLAATATVGQPFSYTVTATNNPITYRATGLPIGLSVNSSTGVISGTPRDAGTFPITLTAANITGTSPNATLVLTVAPSAALANLSVRTTLAGGQNLIVGFVVGGGGKELLVRAAGPSLASFGLSGAMVDPRLQLFKDSALIAENDDWPATLAPVFARLGAFVFPANSRDAAIQQTLSGANSVVASGTGPGVVLVETYGAGSGTAIRLVNLSARNRVGTGSDILIAGFVIAGTGTQRLLIRAIGPGLTGFGVPSVLQDPRLDLFNAQGARINENDNWGASLAPIFATAGAFPLTNGSRDAALVVVLNAGNSYTVQVQGADGGVGESLVELYEVP